MQIFQRNILNKYIESLDVSMIQDRYMRYSDYFLDPTIQENIHQSKEEQFQEGFLRELFVKILGYTLNPSPNYNLITEKKNEGNSKKADGAMLVSGKVVGVIELKDHKTPDLGQIEAQAFGYKNRNKEATYVVISNFEKLRFYIDNAVDFEEFDLFHLSFEDFARLWICLAYENIEKNLPKQIKSASLTNEDQITNALYKDYSNFKRDLFEDILANNPTDSTEHKILLFKKTQKLLDRLLFIFFAEDRGLLPPNSIMMVINQWEKLKDLDEYQPFYNRLKKYFGYMNTGFQGKNYEVFAYNGGLFKPDEILEGLTISDEVLMKNCKRISEYDFQSDVDVNILGHIFENSLTEIEEVTTKLQQGEAPTISKRKKDGVFYTPQYITKYIVENTVGKLCREKKAELGINDSEYFADKKRQVATKKALIEKLDAYRDWLLQISICDPACGSGAFLNAALNFLIAEHKLIDEMGARVEGATIVFPNVENSILENNLYGVDINEESVEIAKLSLWLRTAKPHRKLNSLNDNIKCGNSLIDDPAVAGEKAFNWQNEFPKVFAKGGFDVVIGNPPYVSANELKKSYTEEAYNTLKKNYRTAKGTVDLYIYFFEKGLSILNLNGLLSYITPNRYLSASYGYELRRLIITEKAFYQLIDYSDKKVFEDASTYPVITFLKNRTCHDDIICGKFDDGHNLISRLYPSDKLDILDDDILGFLLNDKLTITKKVIEESVSLTCVGEINATSTAKEADDYAPLIFEIGEGYKLINTGTIDPFVTSWGFKNLTKQGRQYLTPYLPNNSPLVSPNRHSLYSSPKIIISKIGLQCEAFYDKEGIYASIDTNCIHSFTPDFLPEYVLCWLNSKLYNYTFECLFDGLRMSGGYLLYSSPNLRNTYIKHLTIDEQQPFVALSDQMFVLNEQLQQKKFRLLHRLEDNLGLQRITSTLECFYELDFKAFVAELKKQKISLSLAQQDEWEDYFSQYKADCNALSAQIAATDKEIDRMVYDLYGLSDDEIKVVEGE